MSKPPVAYITDRVTASRALSEAYRHDTVAIDTEFNSDDGTIETLQYSWGSGVRVVVAADLLDIFADWLVDPRIRKVYQNYKADREALVELGFYPDELDASFHADIMIETALHDENDRLHDLKHQSKKWLGWPRLPYSKLFAYPVPGRKKPAVLMPRELLRSAPPDALAVRSQAAWRQLFLEYAGDDPESTILCHFVHRQYLEEIGYWQNYQRVDREYTLTLIKMQARGVKIDKQGMQSIRQKVIARKTRAGFCFRQLAGKPDFNFRSAPQKKALYIDELKWPVRDDFLTDKGLELMRFAVTEADKRVIRENFASFSGEAMQWWCDELDHPLAKLHLQTAKAQTLEVTVTGILAGLDQDNYIYTDFNQVGGQLTGRISSRKQRVSTIETYTTKRGIVKTRVVNRTVGMQLQNMPSKVEKDPFRIRDEFICEPSEVVVCADYAGFELMMALFWAAKFTPHSRMLDIMRKYKTPSAIHAFTAIEMMDLGGCGIDQVKKLHPDEYLYSKNCYHPDTEILTRKGWKRIADLTMWDMVAQAQPGPNGSAEISWVKPLALRRFKPDKPVLVALKTEGIDLRVTPDHRMLAFQPYKDGQPHVVTPEELPKKNRGWINAGVLPGGSLNPDVALVRLAVALQADGSYHQSGVTFGFSKQRKIDRLVKLLTAAGMAYTKSEPNDLGVTSFYVSNREIGTVRELLDKQKRLPWTWLNLSLVCRQAVLDEARHWDSDSRGQPSYIYTTTIKQNAEVLQAIASITGRKTRLVKRPNHDWQDLYWLTVRDRATSSPTKNLRAERQAYDGDVVCLQVPTSFVVVRDGGVPVISGNCNFLLIYGGSWKRLCQQLTQAGVHGWDWRDPYNKRRAKDMIARWNDLYPEIAIMQQALIAMGYNLGYVETIAGRRIHVAAGLASRDEGIRGHWERKCINGPCQGSAADIVKDAQNRIELDPMLRGWGYKQRLQVHDEILGTVLRQHAEEACARKTKLMKQPYAAKMPFEIAVDAKYGRSWQAAK